MNKCSIDNCHGKYEAKGFCASHYHRWKKYGTPHKELLMTKPKMDILIRFKRKMSLPDSNGCINWLGALSRYGRFTIGSKKEGTKSAALAHRIAYELFVGDIPKGMYVCHSCDNPSCVNPDHLFIGTQMDNMKDMIAKGRDNKVPTFRWQS